MKTKINLNLLSIGLLILSTIGFVQGETTSIIGGIIALIVGVIYNYLFYIHYNQVLYKLHFTKEELAETRFKLNHQSELTESNKKMLSVAKGVLTTQELLLVDYQQDVNKLNETIKKQKETISELQKDKEDNWLDYGSGM